MNIAQILKKKYTASGPLYQVKWKDESLSWEPHDVIAKFPDKLREFNTFALTGERPSINVENIQKPIIAPIPAIQQPVYQIKPPPIVQQPIVYQTPVQQPKFQHPPLYMNLIKDQLALNKEKSAANTKPIQQNIVKAKTQQQNMEQIPVVDTIMVESQNQIKILFQKPNQSDPCRMKLSDFKTAYPLLYIQVLEQIFLKVQLKNISIIGDDLQLKSS